MSDESVRLIINPSDIAKRTFLYAQEIGYLEVSTDFSLEGSNRDSFLLLDVVLENGMLLYDGQEIALSRGNIVILDGRKPHKFYTTNKKCWFLYLYFNGIQAREYYNYISRDQPNVFVGEWSHTTGSYFWQIIALHKKYTDETDPLTSFHITRILTEICMNRINDEIKEAMFPIYVNDVFHHISHYYKEKITLDILAQRFCISKYHLAREFKRCSGVSISEYLLTTRINKAKSLLRYSDKSIGQIAEEVGFYNSSHFIKLFYKRELITPSSYRKQWTK